MPYWQLFYHVIWSTKNRWPLITPESEPTIYEFLRSKTIASEGAVFALNGMADHVHLVVSITPKIAVAKFIGQIKAFSATKFNKLSTADTPLIWQEEYGVFSFDSKRLPNFVGYVEKQKEHHASNSLIPILERSDATGMKTLHESTSPYKLDESAWFQDMQAQ